MNTHTQMDQLAYYGVCEALIGLPDDIIKLPRFQSDFKDYIAGFFAAPINLPGTTFQIVNIFSSNFA